MGADYKVGDLCKALRRIIDEGNKIIHISPGVDNQCIHVTYSEKKEDEPF